MHQPREDSGGENSTRNSIVVVALIGMLLAVGIMLIAGGLLTE